MRRTERSARATLRDVFGLTGRVQDAAMDALVEAGFNPRVNTLGESSAWVTSGALFDVLDEVQSVQEEYERHESYLPDVGRERRTMAGVVDEDKDVLDPWYDEDMELELTFSYEEDVT